MDYSQEAITSLIWILQTLAITSVVFSFGIFLLVRFTQWENNFGCLQAVIFRLNVALNLSYSFCLLLQ